MVELLKYLESNQCQLPEEYILSTHVIVDVMSQLRRINVKAITTFGDMFQVLVSNVKRVCKCDRIETVRDSYLLQFTKNTERKRRAKYDVVPLTSILSSSKILIEMDRFWSSSENKRMLQAALSDFIAHSPDIENICTFVSEVVLDDGKEQAITVKDK